MEYYVTGINTELGLHQLIYWVSVISTKNRGRETHISQPSTYIIHIYTSYIWLYGHLFIEKPTLTNYSLF